MSDPYVAAQDVLRRLLGPSIAGRVRLAPMDGLPDQYSVVVDEGMAHVSATTPSAALRGANDYLATQGISVGFRSAVLPDAPFQEPNGGMFTGGTDLPHRYALNDTEDGYVGAYRDFDAWERLVDVLAYHGYNQIFVPVGIELAYVRTLQRFGYSLAEALAWVPLPGRQAWWLLQNMDSFAAGFNEELMMARAELGRRVVERIRELGLSPVLPGCAGMVPRNFGTRVRGAYAVPQGLWNGIEQPAWLDPTGVVFREYAATFYSELEASVGAADLYKMDLFHEGGAPGEVNVADAVRAVAGALRQAHPEATWAMLGWLDNPTPEMIEGADLDRTLVVDGVSDRYPGLNREVQWPGAAYLFGSIWNFGGHTSIGAWTDVWIEEFWSWRNKPDSFLRGIAYIPEASGGYPFAFDAFSRLPWESGPVALPEQGVAFADRHYGVSDDHAREAWRIIADVAHRRANEPFSCTHEGLFISPPSLTRSRGSNWQPTQAAFDRFRFARALPELLAVSAEVRQKPPFAEDVVEVARQVMSDASRDWLPQIRKAFEAADVELFDQLTGRWLDAIDRLDALMGSVRHTLMGAWEADALAGLGRFADPASVIEDLRGLVTYWGGDGTLLEYANREWNGLLATYYRPRWVLFFNDLRRFLTHGAQIPKRDWVRFAEEWSADTSIIHSAEPCGDPVGLAEETWRWLLSWFMSLESSSRGVWNPKRFRGRSLSWSWTKRRCSGPWTDRSVLLGKYSRRSRLMFSLDPRCQGQCGSAK